MPTFLVQVTFRLQKVQYFNLNVAPLSLYFGSFSSRQSRWFGIDIYEDAVSCEMSIFTNEACDRTFLLNFSHFGDSKALAFNLQKNPWKSSSVVLKLFFRFLGTRVHLWCRKLHYYPIYRIVWWKPTWSNSNERMFHFLILFFLTSTSDYRRKFNVFL